MLTVDIDFRYKKIIRYI